jgi:signal transduction histidine kinase
MHLCRFYLLALLLGLAALPSLAQTPKIAQMQQQLATAPADTNRVRLLSLLSWELMSHDLPAAMRYQRQALALAERLHYRQGQLHCLNSLGTIAFQSDNTLLATRYYQKALRLMNPARPRETRILTLTLLGMANIANVEDDYQEAEQYYRQVLGRLGQPGQPADPDDLAMVHNNLANLYKRWGNDGHAPDSARRLQEHYARLALAGHRRVGNPNDIAISLDVLADAHLTHQRYDSAAYYLEQGLKLARQTNNQYGQATILGHLAQTRLGQRRWAEAAALARQACAVARQLAQPEFEANGYDVLGQALYQLGDAGGAYRAIQAEQSLRDTLQTTAKRKALARLQVSFDTERKEGRIRELTQAQRLQQTEASRQRQRLWYLLAGLAIVAAGLAAVAVLALGLRRSRAQLARQNEALAAARVTQDQLYGLVAHDLRSPLVAFNGLADLLNHYVQHQDTARLAGLGSRIQQAAQGLSALLDNLLNWAMSQRGELRPFPQALPVAPLLAEAFALYHNAALAAEVSLSHEAPADLLLWADRDMTRTILRNLVGNALKATPAGGQVQLTAAGEAEAVELRVQDSGPGFPAAALAPAAELRLATPGGGAGLGLLLSRRFAQAQGGSLRLANAPVGGAFVILRLPRQ